MVGVTIDNRKGFASLSLSRPTGPSAGVCKLSSTHLFGMFDVSCEEFNGNGGPVSYSIAFAFDSSKFSGNQMILRSHMKFVFMH